MAHPLYVSLCQRIAAALLARKPLSAAEIPNLLETASGQLCTPMRIFWILAMNRLVDLLSANDFAIPEEVAQIKHVPSHPDTASAYNRLRSLLHILRTRMEEQEFRVSDIVPMLKFMRSKIKDTFHLQSWDATADHLKAKFNSRRDDVTILQRTLSWLGATVREPDAQRCVTPVAADAHDKTLSLRRLKENRRLLLAKLWTLLEFREDTQVLDEALHLLTRQAAQAGALLLHLMCDSHQ